MRKSRDVLKFFLFIALFPFIVIGCGESVSHAPPPAPVIQETHKQIKNVSPPAAVEKHQPQPATVVSPKPKTDEARTRVTVSYIGNRRSHIFHRAGCHYVRRMNEGNKVEFDNRDEAIDEGYRPCKKCRP